MKPMSLDTPIEYVKGIGPLRGELLKKELGVFTLSDLFSHYPFRYEDRTKFYKIIEVNDDLPYVQLRGRIIQMQTIGTARQKRFVAMFKDDSGIIELVWFQGVRWIAAALKINVEYVVFGKANRFNSKFNIVHPEIEPVTEENTTFASSLQPVYHTSEKLKAKGLDTKSIARIIKNTLLSFSPGAEYSQLFPETLSNEIIEKQKLISRAEALRNLHFPENSILLQKAQFRMKFEELFFVQLRILKLKVNRNTEIKGLVFSSIGKLFNNFYHDHLPFELTNAQKRVLREIRIDMGSGKQMNRLLQGDVGSGKTMVALLSALMAIDNSFQACLMAPTEILARQHFESISESLLKMDINVGILTGSTKASERKALHNGLQNGEIHLLIGTHALIEDQVQFKNLGLVIIDEQHRFGVEQRARMWKKNSSPPHVLVMTATPIPRTLAMTLYGDLDVSVIDELPPGRKPIQTIHKFDSGRLVVFDFMRKQIAEGRQIYIVYPLIQESEKMDYKDLEDGFESIERAFPPPDFRISIVHGKMKASAKDQEMQRFIKKETQIMVATTVIEVGVNVPNASVMVIESAERFGLSQLHQLRGRVGRGADQSYCILMTSFKLSSDAKVRVETMVRTNDGFEIADVDMRLRGPGDLEGTQQSGIMDLKLADLRRDVQILQLSRDIASSILKIDPDLTLLQHQRIKHHLQVLKSNKQNWSRIS
ncbi:MAG: ATP-dependent DNA helicase RecG [Bacteroidetes bacterium]|nr:ATP-dependent DNA helicase RecG [Bacteroidota bacterium]HET6243986.1 ATP-dependent DNA helicase RecG [Bacteroidia bacterium]